MTIDEVFMKKAIELSALAVEHRNEPFGTVLVKDDEIVYTNEKQIYSAIDLTFHAEAGLIRRFCIRMRITDLRDYTLYSSCEPCFMCSGAMVFAHSSFRPEVTSRILRDESVKILEQYFAAH